MDTQTLFFSRKAKRGVGQQTDSPHKNKASCD